MAAYVALALAYVLSQFYRSFLAVLTTMLQADLGVSASDLAYASGAWFAAFALAQFPIGYLLDTYGPRRTAALLHGVAGGGGALVFAVAQDAIQLTIALALIGAGCAPVLMAAMYLFARNFPPAKFATLGSSFIAFGTLGNVAGAAPLAAAVEAWGWRPVSIGLAAVTFAVGAAIWFLVSDPRRVEQDASLPKGGYLSLLKIRELWPILPCILLGYAVAAGIRGLWAGPFLSDVYGLSTFEIGRVTLYMALALAAGSLLYGPLDRIFDSRKNVVLAGNLVVLAAVLWLWLATPSQPSGAALLFVAIGLFGATYAVQITHGKAFVPAHLTGRGVTLMNFFSIGGVGLMQVVSGILVEQSGDQADPMAAYRALFGLYAVSLAAVLAIYLFSRDARPSQG